jgi:hypothetical protein
VPSRIGQRVLPLRLRACRSLLWAQAAYTFFAGLFVLLTAVFLGGSFSIPLRDGAISGGGAAALAFVYMAAAAALAGLGLAVGRRAAGTRPAVAGVEAIVIVLLVLRTVDLSPPTIIGAGLAMAIVGLLFMPATARVPTGSSSP